MQWRKHGWGLNLVDEFPSPKSQLHEVGLVTALVSVNVMDSPKQTVVGDAEKDAVGPNTKKAQSSLKLVWLSNVKIRASPISCTVEHYQRKYNLNYGFPDVFKIVKLVLLPFLTSNELINWLFSQNRTI